MILFHGSKDIIEKPIFGYGKKTNDYGQGFYLTKEYELGCEWSVSSDIDGYINKYEIDTKELKIINLEDKNYSILHWLTVLLNNRTFAITSPLMQEAKDYLIKYFSLDLSIYDIIVGYRADDSYFSFARDFLQGIISLEQLYKAMKLGKLGTQYVLMSKKAFNSIKYIESNQIDHNIYYNQKMLRDENARKDYLTAKQKASRGLFMINILQENILPNDKRLYL